MPRVITLCPSKSLPTYRAGFERLAEAFGTRPVDSITPLELAALRDRVRSETGCRLVDSARRRDRRLLSYDPDAHGRGAAENFVRAARFFFRVAVDVGARPSSPAARVFPPRRAPAPERPLTTAELADLYRVATTTGDDTELDHLLVLFLRHTAARREGSLNLTLDALDPERARITVSEKNGHTRWLPLDPSLIRTLDRFGRARGAERPFDAVFRYRTGAPLTRRRYNTLFDRLDRHTDWSEPLDVGAHWIRHTTLSDIAAVAGLRVAHAYAGHSTSSAASIYRYTDVEFDDLATAYRAVFG